MSINENYILISHEKSGFKDRCNYIDMDAARKQCMEITGSVQMPAVIYKGMLIERGIFGTRKINHDRIS